MSVILGVVLSQPPLFDDADSLADFFENLVSISPLDVSFALGGTGDLRRQNPYRNKFSCFAGHALLRRV